MVLYLIFLLFLVPDLSRSVREPGEAPSLECDDDYNGVIGDPSGIHTLHGNLYGGGYRSLGMDSGMDYPGDEKGWEEGEKKISRNIRRGRPTFRMVSNKCSKKDVSAPQKRTMRRSRPRITVEDLDPIIHEELVTLTTDIPIYYQKIVTKVMMQHKVMTHKRRFRHRKRVIKKCWNEPELVVKRKKIVERRTFIQEVPKYIEEKYVINHPHREEQVVDDGEEEIGDDGQVIGERSRRYGDGRSYGGSRYGSSSYGENSYGGSGGYGSPGSGGEEDLILRSGTFVAGQPGVSRDKS